MSNQPDSGTLLDAHDKAGGQYRWLPWMAAVIAILLALLLAGLMTLSGFAAFLFVAALAVIIAASDLWRGFVLLLVATQLNGLTFDYGAFTFRQGQLVLLVVTISFILMFAQGRVRVHATVLDLPIAGLLLVGFISSFLNSPDPAYSYQALLLQTVYALMYFVSVNILLDNKSKLDSAVKVLMVLGMLHAIYAIVAFGAFFTGFKLGGISSAHFNTLSLPSTSGLFQEANLFAAFVGVVAILFASHLISQRDTGILSKRTLALGLALLLTTVLTSMTRSVWASLGFILLMLLFFSRPRRNVINPRAMAILGVMLVTMAMLVLPVLNFAFSQASGTSDALIDRMSDVLNFGSTSAAGRLDVQEIAFERWTNEPIIGHGVLSLPGEEENYGRAWFYSTFVQSLYDTGLVGVFFILWLHLVPIGYGLYAATTTDDPMRKANLVGLSLGALLMTIASQASSFFWLGFPWVYLALLVAISRATLDDQKGERRAQSGEV